MHLLGFVFFLAAFCLSMTVVLNMLLANRTRIFEALMGEMPELETRPPAEIYHFPLRRAVDVEWREAA